MIIRQPPRADWIAYVPWRPWFRVPAVAVCIAGTLAGLVYLVLGALHFLGVRILVDISPVEAVGIGALLAASGPLGLAVIESGELVVAKPGLWMGTNFIMWSAVDEVRDEPASLSIITPSLRRYWNGWSGRLAIPKILFAVPPDFGSRLRAWIQTARGQTSRG